MTANATEGTAKIYQFPKGGRAGLSSGRYEADSTHELASTRVEWVSCGSASYHEDAIRNEEHAHDR